MIAFLRGTFVRLTPALVQVDVGGVGYEVHISLNTYADIAGKEGGILLTHLHIREDAHVLYGFSTEDEKNLFLQLLSVSGIGASTARMMLSSMKPGDIRRAVLEGNARLLESIKGIGRKTAERVVLELRDKLVKTAPVENRGALIHNTLDADALDALLALGIARSAAEKAMSKARSAHPEIQKVEELIKIALQNL